MNIIIFHISCKIIVYHNMSTHIEPNNHNNFGIVINKKVICASLSSSLIMFPIESILRRKQTTKNTIRQIVGKNNIKTFYNGLGIELFCYPFFWTCYFSLNDAIKNKKIVENKFGNNMITSYVSAVGALFIVNPSFTIKTNAQTTKMPIGTTINNLYQKNGVAGFYKGVTMSAVNNVKLSIMMPLYSYFKEDKGFSSTSASFVSKFIGNTIFYPSDLVRTIQRTNIEKKSFVSIVSNIYKENGMVGYFRGYFMYNLVSIPNFVLMMVFKDLLETYFHKL